VAEDPLQQQQQQPFAVGLSATPGGGWVPVPDPTALTTQQLRRELSTMQEFLELRISSLKELTFTRFDASAEALSAALAAAKEASEKADKANESKFSAVNEFRAQQGDLIAGFLTKAEYASAHQTVLDGLSVAREQLAALSGTVVPRQETDAWRAALIDKFESNLAVIADGLKIQDSQQEERIRALESKTAGLEGGKEGTRDKREDEQRETNNRLVLMGVAISLVVIVVNVIIALVLK
jgi:hypothetical protein